MSAAAALPPGGAAQRLLVYGSRVFARTVADLARDCGHEVVGYVDDMGEGPEIVGTIDSATAHRAELGADGMLLGIGYSDLVARWGAWQRLTGHGWLSPTLVHPRAYVARSVRLGAGCFVMAGAIVDRESCLGDAVVLWPGACINHDVEIGDNSFVSPNATLCGHVRVGANCFVGAGACIADASVVAASSFIRMGERVSTRVRT